MERLDQEWIPSRKRKYNIYYDYMYSHTEEFPFTTMRLFKSDLFHPTNHAPLSLAPVLPTIRSQPHQFPSRAPEFNDVLFQSAFCVITKGPDALYELSHAIYAGCIPILLSDSTHFPFTDLFDYPKFTVRVHETDLNTLADTLQQLLLPPTLSSSPSSSSPSSSSILDALDALQQNLRLVRSAFLYAPSNTPEDLRRPNNKGPFHYLMHSLALRLGSKYPTSAA